MIRWIARNMVGNKYHNLIMLLAIFSLLMVCLAGYDSLMNANALRMCAGCIIP